MLRGWRKLFLLACLGVVAYGLWEIWLQHRRLWEYEPVAIRFDHCSLNEIQDDESSEQEELVYVPTVRPAPRPAAALCLSPAC